MIQKIYLGKTGRGNYTIVHQRTGEDGLTYIYNIESRGEFVYYLRGAGFSALGNIEFFNGISSEGKKRYFPNYHGSPNPLNKKDLEDLSKEAPIVKIKQEILE